MSFSRHAQLWGGGAPFKKNADGTLTDKSGTKYVSERENENTQTCRQTLAATGRCRGLRNGSYSA